MVNRTQALVLGFFLLAVASLVVIRLAAPDVYDEALRLPTGDAVRVSFGLASNASDAQRLLAFVEASYLDRDVSAEPPLPPRLRC